MDRKWLYMPTLDTEYVYWEMWDPPPFIVRLLWEKLQLCSALYIMCLCLS